MAQRPYEHMELLAELWGFLPVDVLDCIYNAGHTAIKESLTEFDRAIRSSFPNVPVDPDFMKCLASYERHLNETHHHAFNKFQELMISNVLKLPSDLDVVLPHYEDLQLDYTEEAEKRLDEELEQARQDIVSQKAFQHVLRLEITHLDNQIQSLDEYQDVLGVLSQYPREQQVYPVNDTMRLLATQVDQLHSIVLKSLEQIKEQDILNSLDQPDVRTLYLNRVVQEQLNAFVAERSSYHRSSRPPFSSSLISSTSQDAMRLHTNVRS